jgi:hypothetical protein
MVNKQISKRYVVKAVAQCQDCPKIIIHCEIVQPPTPKEPTEIPIVKTGEEEIAKKIGDGVMKVIQVTTGMRQMNQGGCNNGTNIINLSFSPEEYDVLGRPTVGDVVKITVGLTCE